MAEAAGRSIPAHLAGRHEVFAALDLGTNNCRLLVATPSADGFRVIDSYSRIVRLGADLAQTGVLAEAAMERAFTALGVCAGIIRRRNALQVRAVATQACRAAANGLAFLAEVERRTGLQLSVITPDEEARLAVAGCLDLIDSSAKAAIVLDVGGGSTEVSWLDVRPRHRGVRIPTTKAWLSIPLGVVSLAERYPAGMDPEMLGFRAMVETVAQELRRFTGADGLRGLFDDGMAHLIGTSGAITSLAGVHLGLARYERRRIDGLWMSKDQCEATARRLSVMSVAERGAQPCIGLDRADLVVAGAAILQAVLEQWPCDRVRVADRGLREGLLLSLMAEYPRGVQV